YMTVTQALTGHGGWPMTVLMTPDRKPFFAGTYFPKRGRSGRPGLLDILPQVAAAWANDRQKIEDSADHITSAIQEALGWQAAGDALGPDVLDTAYNQLAGRFDEVHGGFGAAPKFPTPHNLTFLLRQARRAGTETLVGKRALAMVEK